MKFLKLGAAAAVLGFAAGIVSPAAADQVTVNFNFNDMNAYNSASGKPTGNSSQNMSSSVIAAYMKAVLKAAFTASSSSQIKGYANTVAANVTGGIGQQGTSSYDGEDHAVGPVIGSKAYELTLANTEGAKSPDNVQSTWASNPPVLSDSNKDGFIKNCTSVTDPAYSSKSGTGCSPANSSDIFMSFSGISGLKITSISFDFQIFPNGDCTADTSGGCGGSVQSGTGHRPNYPDLSVWTGDNGGGTQLGEYWGIDPGTGSTYNHSLTSGTGSTETAPQRLDTGIINASLSGKSLASLNLTSLDFMDWPATIGIDNLSITFAPEPGSLAIFGIGLLGLGALMRRRRAPQAAV